MGKNYFEGNDGIQNSLVFQVGEKYLKNSSDSNSSKISIWKSKGLSSQSLILSGSVDTANNIKMSKPIRPDYVIFNHKESFFEQKRKHHKNWINSKYLYSIQSISKNINSDNALKNCLFGVTKAIKQMLQILINTFTSAMVLHLIVLINLVILRVKWLEI